eukprot:137171-Chlamydomonas_euryale.AAC.4
MHAPPEVRDDVCHAVRVQLGLQPRRVRQQRADLAHALCVYQMVHQMLPHIPVVRHAVKLSVAAARRRPAGVWPTPSRRAAAQCGRRHVPAGWAGKGKAQRAVGRCHEVWGSHVLWAVRCGAMCGNAASRCNMHKPVTQCGVACTVRRPAAPRTHLFSFTFTSHGLAHT